MSDRTTLIYIGTQTTDSEFLKITQTHQVLPAQFHLAHLNLDTYSEVACVASVSVQFGSKELQGDEWSE